MCRYRTCNGVKFQVSKSCAGIKTQRHIQLIYIHAVQRERVQGIGHIVLLTVALLCRLLHGDGHLATAATEPTAAAATVLGAGKIVQAASHVHQLDGRAVAIEVDQAPERLARIDPCEENAFVATVDAKMDIAVRCEVVVDESVGFGVALRKSLGPVAWLAGQVGAGILGQALHCCWVVRGEAQSEMLKDIKKKLFNGSKLLETFIIRS